MWTQQTVLELIDLIYAAAADSRKWPLVLQRLASVLKGNVATLHNQHLISKEAGFAADWNMDPQAIKEYTTYYAPLNVWFTTHQELLTEGQVFTNSMLCPDDLLVRTEFYNDWLKPSDMGQAIGVMVFKSGPATSSLSVFRRINEPPFGETELRFLYPLMPHLQRAIQLHSRIQGLEAKARTVEAVLDTLNQGVILLDAKGRVLSVNREADAIFANGNAIRLTPRGLVAAIPSESQRLNRLIQGAISTGNGKGLDSGGAMTITRELQRPLQVLVTPLRTRMVYLGRDVPVAAIFISDPDRKPLSESQVFARLFGLTPAEARLAQILASGDSLKEASEQLGVAESTVRSQLKTIFTKTNTTRQSQLVRLMLLTPPQIVVGAP